MAVKPASVTCRQAMRWLVSLVQHPLKPTWPTLNCYGFSCWREEVVLGTACARCGTRITRQRITKAHSTRAQDILGTPYVSLR